MFVAEMGGNLLSEPFWEATVVAKIKYVIFGANRTTLTFLMGSVETAGSVTIHLQD